MVTGILEHRLAVFCQCNPIPIYSLNLISRSLRSHLSSKGRLQRHLASSVNVRYKHEARSGRLKALDKTHKIPETSLLSRKDDLHSLTYANAPIYPDINLRPTKSRDRAVKDESLSSTRPAAFQSVDPATPDENGSISLKDRIGYGFRLGKSALNFYKTGLKNTWLNFKEVRDIRKRIGRYTIEQAAKYGGSSITQNADNKVPYITRREYQLCVRTQADLRKLGPFAVIFLIFGEFTPLVITFIPPTMLPNTCLLPKQQIQLQNRPLDRLSSYEKEWNNIFKPANSSSSNSLYDSNKAEALRQDLFVTAYLLGLHPFPKPIPILTTILNSVFVKSSLKRHFEQILCDTILIRREGGFAALSAQDVFDYSLKYGLLTLIQYMRIARKTDQPYDVERWKDKLVPILEQEADWMLDCDWRTIEPSSHWLQAYRQDVTASPDYKMAEKIYKSAPN